MPTAATDLTVIELSAAPELRALDRWWQQERAACGAYTGSFGYLNRDGSLDLNILVRTMVMRGSQVTLRAASGIVPDAKPRAELAETRAKAKGLHKALSA